MSLMELREPVAAAPPPPGKCCSCCGGKKCCHNFRGVWLVIMNLCFLAIGVIFLCIGLRLSLDPLMRSVLTIPGTTDTNVTENSMVVADLIVYMIMGCFGIILGCVGLVYVCVRGTCWTIVYAVLMVQCAIMQLVVLTLVVLSWTQVSYTLADDMFRQIQVLDQGDSLQTSWDDMQSYYGCCGVYSYVNWRNTNFASLPTNDSVPWSCCILNSTASGATDATDVANMPECQKEAHQYPEQNNTTWLYTEGCWGYLYNDIQYYTEVFFWLTIIMYILQVLGCIVLALISSANKIHDFPGDNIEKAELTSDNARAAPDAQYKGPDVWPYPGTSSSDA